MTWAKVANLRGKEGQKGDAGIPAPIVDIGEVAKLAVALIPKPIDGKDGKDAAQPDIDLIAVKAASLIPRPSFDSAVVEALRLEVATLRGAHESITAANAAMAKSIETLRSELEQSLSDRLTKSLAALPQPRDGRDVDAATLEAVVAAHVDRAVSVLPKPKDGKSITVEELAPLIQAETAKAVAALPKPAEVVSVQNAMINRDGELVITFSDGRISTVGAVVGSNGKDADMEALRSHIAGEIAKLPKPKDGAPGKDGRDAVIKGNVMLKRIDERRSAWCWSDGDGITVMDLDGTFVKDGALFYPTPIHRGVFADGTTYEPFDQVTHGGSIWMAKTMTTARPEERSSDWLLVCKRGRDGKQGEKGEKGESGRDLTQLGADGRKW